MKKRLARIIIGGILFVLGMVLKTDNNYVEFGIYLAGYVIAGGDIVIRAVKNIFRGQVFDENFLMSVATIGAFIIGEYPEGVAVMLFYQVGELFQSYAVDKSRKSITSLMDIRPDFANVKRGCELIKTDPDEVRPGEIIVVKAGEKIPLDGKIINGNSLLDTSALTGESVPREVLPGSEVLSGCINLNGLITVEVTKEYGDSTVSKILDLVENATSKKARTENFITKFAKYYTPIVVILAAFISIIPPLVINGASFGDWVYRGLTFLVISCPCALVISIPLGFFGGIGGASKKGILVKGGNYLEALAKTEIVVFDKTGTLTKGVFNVQEIHGSGIENSELLELASYAESYSNHPISISLKNAYGKDIDNARIADVEEIPGHGVRAAVDDKIVLAGNDKLMATMNISYPKKEISGTVVHVAVNDVYAGYIVIADEIKEDSRKAIMELKKTRTHKTVMLTGDSKDVAENTAKKLGIDIVYSELLPDGKVEKLELLLSQKSPQGKLAFVGDGINDAPVLARADIGIAMGGLGSDAAIEAADVVIMTDEPSKIVDAVKISRKTLGIVYQNIFFALTVKLLILILAAVGIASMWGGVIADVGVSVLAILNAMRGLNG